MSLKKQPVTGMKDILPDEMTLRDYLIGVIKETYRSFGFTPMETPCVEHIENLTSKQGGDNEKLIFKILKRGEKLRLADAAGEEMRTTRQSCRAPLRRCSAVRSGERTARRRADTGSSRSAISTFSARRAISRKSS